MSSRAAQQDNAATADPGLATAAVDDIVPCEQDALQQNDPVDVLGLAELSQRGSTSSGGSAPTGMVALPCAAVTADLPKAVPAFPLMNGRSGTLYGRGRPAEHSGKNGSYDKALSCMDLRCLSTYLRYATSSNASRPATSSVGSCVEMRGHPPVSVVSPHSPPADDKTSVELKIDGAIAKPTPGMNAAGRPAG